MSQTYSDMGDKKRSAKFYALRIKDCPGWPSGATAIVKQGARKEIEEYDHVVYHDHQGVDHFGFINFTENNITLTKTLLPAMFPRQPIILPRKEIERFDLIVSIAARDDIGKAVLRGMRQRQRLEKYVEGIAK